MAVAPTKLLSGVEEGGRGAGEAIAGGVLELETGRRVNDMKSTHYGLCRKRRRRKGGPRTWVNKEPHTHVLTKGAKRVMFTV